MKPKIKYTVELSVQQMEDLKSAVSFTVSEYANVRWKGNGPKFVKALEAINKKLWQITRLEDKRQVLAQSLLNSGG